MAPMKQTQLAEPTILQTHVPFPVIDIETLDGDSVVLGKHETDTIVVESASELVTSSITTSLFRTQKGDNSSLNIVHDANGRPMVFSVGSDGLLDITPVAENASVSVTAFDVLEIKQDLHFSASVRYTPGGSEETHQVFWASIKQPNAQITDGQLAGFTASDLKWKPIQNNLGPRVITKLVNVVNPDAVPGSPAFTIFAATRTTETHLASTYAINPSQSASAPWTIISFGAQSYSIVDMQPVIVGSASKGAKKRAGLTLLHDAPSQKADVERRCHVLTLNDARNEAFGLIPLNTEKISSPSAIWTSFNSWGSHDVLVAGNGIAFHQFQNLNDPCLDSKGDVILPHITFRQVTCKETMLANPRRYILSILAVSEDDELYLIEGERDATNFGLPTFNCSGLPVRTNVAQIACHYNKQIDAIEFIYTTKRDNQISHLARDSKTGVWISTDLQVQGPGTLAKENQYVTTITLLSKATGDPVPEGYPVSLKSEPVFVKINDLAYRLNRMRPTVVKTNAAGQIDIVTAAPDHLGISSLELSLESGTRDSGPNYNVEDNSSSIGSETTLVEWHGAAAQTSEKGAHVQRGEQSWIEKAVDVAVEYIGDALEFLKTVVKQTVKFVVKVGAKVLRIYLRIQGKVLSFVVKHTAALVRSVKLKDVALGSLTVLERFLAINRSSLEDLFNDAETLIFGSVERLQEPQAPRQETTIERFIKRILNSPIVKLILKFNPLSWILEGVSEGLSESLPDFKLPDITSLAEAIGMTGDALLEVFLTAFGQIIENIATSGTEALLNPKQMLGIIISAIKKASRTLFHATRDTILIAVDCIIRVIHVIPGLLTEAWTIPGLTDVWEDWTGQEFSLINFATYGSAVLLDLMTFAVLDQVKTSACAPFRPGWAERIEMEPLYTSFQDTRNQAVLAARYPGPSRPEDTNPMVMMVMADYGSISQKDDEKQGAAPETEETSNSSFNDWMSIVGGLFKLVTNGLIVYQAGRAEEPIGRKMVAFKTVTALVALGSMIGEGSSYITSSVEKANKDPKDIANLGQNLGMSAGLSVAVVGVMVEAYMDITKAVTDARIANMDLPFDEMDKQRQYQAQNKVAHCVGGCALNIGAAAMTGCVPGCWSKPRWGNILQTGASVGGAVAVVAANYFDETPKGKAIKWGMLITDSSLTVASMYSGFSNIVAPAASK
ncbi:hypothetical protein NEUTE1DRAFT_126669 [Neurospora tetrasperma FGSC 2508]|uniref:Uncharacterized protein n=1 Tax=Neurospora tetrasperma (strain FGSC 2508 / ATCC MYA-4615 / P0657) TaxID=510951 RepID=F8N2S8_NEUT8|nr:uncharacterized protein NEUTE1DRAFT_126669 [Neurospora tetrasperma FGSC 2508]EGO53342.1 hypothetical protein NEUTE1DRAFT_126669 [Neurospora tetrasperma FGSC 2508]